MKKKISFEDAMEQLEKIVANLENGESQLKESYDMFEQGIKLSKYCEDILNDTEKKVEILLKNSEGELVPQPFEDK